MKSLGTVCTRPYLITIGDHPGPVGLPADCCREASREFDQTFSSDQQTGQIRGHEVYPLTLLPNRTGSKDRKMVGSRTVSRLSDREIRAQHVSLHLLDTTVAPFPRMPAIETHPQQLIGQIRSQVST